MRKMASAKLSELPMIDPGLTTEKRNLREADVLVGIAEKRVCLLGRSDEEGQAIGSHDREESTRGQC